MSATNWTDLTLFTSGEVATNLPPFFKGLPSSAKTDYQVETKRDIERMINDVFLSVGRSTTAIDDNFNIEEIENGTILHESALQYNYLLIARFNMTNIEDVEDKYGSYYTGNKKWVMEQLNKDVKQLTFASPEGVNQLSTKYTRLSK